LLPLPMVPVVLDLGFPSSLFLLEGLTLGLKFLALGLDIVALGRKRIARFGRRGLLVLGLARLFELAACLFPLLLFLFEFGLLDFQSGPVRFDLTSILFQFDFALVLLALSLVENGALGLDLVVLIVQFVPPGGQFGFARGKLGLAFGKLFLLVLALLVPLGTFLLEGGLDGFDPLGFPLELLPLGIEFALAGFRLALFRLPGSSLLGGLADLLTKLLDLLPGGVQLGNEPSGPAAPLAIGQVEPPSNLVPLGKILDFLRFRGLRKGRQWISFHDFHLDGSNGQPIAWVEFGVEKGRVVEPGIGAPASDDRGPMASDNQAVDGTDPRHVESERAPPVGTNGALRRFEANDALVMASLADAEHELPGLDIAEEVPCGIGLGRVADLNHGYPPVVLGHSGRVRGWGLFARPAPTGEPSGSPGGVWSR